MRGTDKGDWKRMIRGANAEGDLEHCRLSAEAESPSRHGF